MHYLNSPALRSISGCLFFLILMSGGNARAGVILRLGPTFSKASLARQPDYSEEGVEVGPYAAILGEVPLESSLQLLVGGGVERRGFKMDVNGYDERFQLTYLTLPLLLSINPPGAGVFINLGFEPAYLTSANWQIDENPGQPMRGVYPFDLSVCAEAGFDIAWPGHSFPGRSVMLGLGYTQGLVNMDYEWDGIVATRNRGIHAFVALRLGR